MRRPGLADALLLAGIVAVALWLRAGTFALVHDRGDQLIWAGVARNIAARGTSGYTVRGIDVVAEPRGDGAALLRFAPAPAPGSLLEAFKATGEKYWDAPLANQPPGFFAVLLASHAVLGRADDGFPLLASDERAKAIGRAQVEAWFRPREDELRARGMDPDERARAIQEVRGQALARYDEWENGLARRIAARPPEGAVRGQLWATLPPVISDLATVVLLFCMGWASGGRAVGAIAALAFATDPLALYCAHRLLSNATLALACVATLALERVALASPRREALSVAVGALAGFAIAVKVSALFILPALVGGRVARGIWRERAFAYLVVAAAVTTTPWWLLQWKLLGHPLGFAWAKQAHRAAESPWSALVMLRDPLYYARSLGCSPLVALGGLVALVRLARWRDANDLAGPLFALAVCGAAAAHTDKEARHILLVYPVLALESARLLVRAPRLAAAVAVVAAVTWEAHVGLRWAFDVARAP